MTDKIEGFTGQGNMLLLSRANMVVHSSLELMQTQPLNTAQLHNHSSSEQRQDAWDEEQFTF